MEYADSKRSPQIVYGNIGTFGSLLALYGGDEVRLAHPYPQKKPKEDHLLRQDGALFVIAGNDRRKEKTRQAIKRLQLPEQSMKIDEFPHVIYYAILPPANPR